MVAAIMIGPAIASAQPAQTPPTQPPPADQNATQAQNQTQEEAKPDAATNNTDAATTNPGAAATCDPGNKAADAKTDHSSAKVGKDTGDVPPPRKKKDVEAACEPQPK
jgi:hypothetical protein